MGLAEALLPGIAEEKRFIVLQRMFAGGHAISLLLFFLPVISICVKDFDATAYLSAETLPQLIELRAMPFNPDSTPGLGFILYGILLAHSAALILSFIKPERQVFVAGGFLGLMWLAVALVGTVKVGQGSLAVSGVYHYREVWASMNALATLVSVLSAAAIVLGFAINPPPTAASVVPLRWGTTRDLPGLAAAISGGTVILCLAVIAIVLSGRLDQSTPLKLTFRDSLVPSGGKVLVIENVAAGPVEDCVVLVRGRDGKTCGPHDLGNVWAHRSIEVGWRELGDWVLEKGHAVTVSCKGCRDVEIIVPE